MEQQFRLPIEGKQNQYMKPLNMKMPIESFKGMEFVRISSMPKDQQDKIWETFQHDKIIKIVRDKALMNDCILYHDFITWQANQPKCSAPTTTDRISTGPIGKLAFN